jgi:serralysin
MPTIRQLGDQPLTFLDAIAALDALLLRTEIETRSLFSFEGRLLTDPRVTFRVDGDGFYFDEQLGRDVLLFGTIQDVTVLFEGEPVLEITDLDLRASEGRGVVDDVIDGDTLAVAEYFLEFDYDYLGSGLDETSVFLFQDVRVDPTGDDVFDLGPGTHDFYAGRGDDVLIGGPQGDVLDGGPGDDIIQGLLGADVIRGGPGQDVAFLYGLQGAGLALLRTDLPGQETVYSIDRAERVFDTFTGVEEFDDSVQTIELTDVPRFDALAYAASYPDLARAFGTDEEALLNHYLRNGFFEGREITFDASDYLANYADLRAAFGSDEDAATRHYVKHGMEAGRLPVDPLAYVASFADLSRAFGDLPEAAMRAAGLAHHQRFGAAEGRTDDIDFDAATYLANFPDLRAAFGSDEDAATLHYARSGREAGRLAEDALTYLASFDDLVIAADARGPTSEEQLRAFATSHFRLFGEAEGRDERIGFNADAYLSNYGDLRSAFADGDGGYDEEAATLHWIRNGFEAGRVDELILI